MHLAVARAQRTEICADLRRNKPRKSEIDPLRPVVTGCVHPFRSFPVPLQDPSEAFSPLRSIRRYLEPFDAYTSTLLARLLVEGWEGP